MYPSDSLNYWASISGRYLPRRRIDAKEQPLTEAERLSVDVQAELNWMENLQGWDRLSNELMGLNRMLPGRPLTWVKGSEVLFAKLRKLTLTKPLALELLNTHQLHPDTAHLLKRAQALDLWEDDRWRDALRSQTPTDCRYAASRWDDFAGPLALRERAEHEDRCAEHDTRAVSKANQAQHEVAAAFGRRPWTTALWIECGLKPGRADTAWAFELGERSERLICALAAKLTQLVADELDIRYMGLIVRADYSVRIGHRFTFVSLIEDYRGFVDIERCDAIGSIWNRITDGGGCFYNHNERKQWFDRHLGVIGHRNHASRAALADRVATLFLADRHLYFESRLAPIGMWTLST